MRSKSSYVLKEQLVEFEVSVNTQLNAQLNTQLRMMATGQMRELM